MYEPDLTTSEKVIDFFKALGLALYLVLYLAWLWLIGNTHIMNFILQHFTNVWAGAGMASLLVAGPLVIWAVLLWLCSRG